MHLLVKVPPKLSISGLMGVLKGRSAIRLFTQCPSLRKKPYWGNHFWGKGDIQEMNIHSLEHYLGHPDVQVQMLRMLVGWSDSITQAHHESALRVWREGRLKNKLRDKAKDDLKEYLITRTKDWKNEIPMLVEFRTAILRNGRKDGES